MKILFIYPEYTETFWSFRHALKFVSKKAAFPPLGLLTVAAMLPEKWQKKLVDMNVGKLSDKDIKWADYVFISAMTVQRDSVTTVIDRCKKLGTKIVAGGPLFTTGYEEFPDVDYFVLGEAEVTLQPFVDDLEKGVARHIYTSDERPDINMTPIPQWSLINMNHYSSMNVQYSRGCPYDCEFCDIIVLNGHKPRTKNKAQIVKELDALYNNGWKGGVFIVDDNFIGNKMKLKKEILPAIIEWRKNTKYPFALSTEASINMADDEELMSLMGDAGFTTVFIGIESPNEDSLAECNKFQNQNRDLIASVKKIQNFGMEVQGGFIIGFDSDTPAIFQNQIEFIQKSGIVTAMVGLLNAPRGTKLYKRLKQENRLTSSFTGNNTDCSLNFIPKMNVDTLLHGYKQVLNTIYSVNHYYDRIRTFLYEYKPRGGIAGTVQIHHIKAFLRSIFVLGIWDKGRVHFWKLFTHTLVHSPRKFPITISLAVYGYHFRKVVESDISV